MQMIAVVVAAVMETSLPTSTNIFWLIIILLNLAVKTEMELLLCINCGTKITIPAGSGTHWHRSFVTHRETDKCRGVFFTPQDIVDVGKLVSITSATTTAIIYIATVIICNCQGRWKRWRCYRQLNGGNHIPSTLQVSYDLHFPFTAAIHHFRFFGEVDWALRWS